MRTEGEIPLPCLVYTPVFMSADTRTVIYVMEEGKSSLAVNDSLIESYMRRGDVLVLADLRGDRDKSKRMMARRSRGDLDEAELMTLLKAEEVSREKRHASATIAAHLQHMAHGATTAGLSAVEAQNSTP